MPYVYLEHVGVRVETFNKYWFFIEIRDEQFRRMQ